MMGLWPWTPSSPTPVTSLARNSSTSPLLTAWYPRPAPQSRLSEVLLVKWLDYSSKYGLAFVLSNGTVGVLFRDGSQMLRDRGAAHAWLLPALRGGGTAAAGEHAPRGGELLQPQPLPAGAQALLLPAGNWQRPGWGTGGTGAGEAAAGVGAGHSQSRARAEQGSRRSADSTAAPWVAEAALAPVPGPSYPHDVLKKLKLLCSFESMLVGGGGGGRGGGGDGSNSGGEESDVSCATLERRGPLAQKSSERSTGTGAAAVAESGVAAAAAADAAGTAPQAAAAQAQHTAAVPEIHAQHQQPQGAATATAAASPPSPPPSPPPPPRSPPSVWLTWWARTHKALAVCMSSGAMQVRLTGTCVAPLHAQCSDDWALFR